MRHLLTSALALAGVVIMVTGCSSIFDQVTPAQITGPDIAPYPSYERGKYYLRKNYKGLALNQFQSALNKEPDSIKVLNALAITYQELNRSDIAIIMFEKALRLNSRSSQTLNNYGYFHLSTGNPEKAIPLLSAVDQDQEYAAIALTNLKFAKIKLSQKVEKLQAALSEPVKKTKTTLPAKHVSLERISKKVYVLNSRFNARYENALIDLMLDPQLIVRSAYTD